MTAWRIGDLADDVQARVRPEPLLIVGLGSPHGDDRIGWAVIDRLGARPPGAAAARKVRGGAELLELLDGQSGVILVDASAPTGRAGTLRRIEWPSPSLGEGGLVSSHGLGLVGALRMAEAIGRLPRRVVIFAVEAQDTGPGRPMSWAGRRGVEAAVEAIASELAPGPRGREESGPCTSCR
jgi:hydrogenase maturation protease